MANITDTENPAVTQNDPVNHPGHYTQGPFECIELTSKLDFLVGNTIKYLWRHNDKAKPVQDLEKAKWYWDYTDNPFKTLVNKDLEYQNAVSSYLQILVNDDFAGLNDIWSMMLNGMRMYERGEMSSHTAQMAKKVISDTIQDHIDQLNNADTTDATN